MKYILVLMHLFMQRKIYDSSPTTNYSGLTFVESFLEICNFQFGDEGTYTCITGHRDVVSSRSITVSGIESTLCNTLAIVILLVACSVHCNYNLFSVSKQVYGMLHQMLMLFLLACLNFSRWTSA